MKDITMPATTITPEQCDIKIRQLVASIMLQATKDYCRTKSDKRKAAILKDLRSKHMKFLSDGMSVVVAEQLEKHPDEIAARLNQNEEVYGIIT